MCTDDEGGDGSEFDRESDSEEEEGEGRGGAEKKPFKVDVHEGKTVFVRSVGSRIIIIVLVIEFNVRKRVHVSTTHTLSAPHTVITLQQSPIGGE